MHDVVTIGAATVDIFIKSEQFLVQDNKFLSLYYSSKNEINQSLICSGGGATNAAVSFSRLGLKTGSVSLLGKDPLSKYILSDLTNDSVDTSYLIEKKQESTDFSVILVAPDGGRTILTNRGSSRLEDNDIPWDKLNAKWIYITSVEGNLDLIEKIIGFAKEKQIKVSFNPGRRELEHPRRVISLLPHVDFLLLNKTESEQLTGLEVTHPKFWETLVSYRSSIIAVTNGRDGAHILTKDKSFYSPIINTKPVDETGAGDAFGSTFVSALIYGLHPSEALFWSVRNSASVVSFLGAKTGLLTIEEMRK